MELAISILENQLDTVQRSLKLGVKMFGSPLHTKEDLEDLQKSIEAIKKGGKYSSSGFASGALRRYMLRHGVDMKKRPAAKQSKAIMELADGVIDQLLPQINKLV